MFTQLREITTRAISRIFGPPASHNTATLWSIFFQSYAGVPVDANTALNYSGVWACTFKIADTFAATPRILYRKQSQRVRTEADDTSLYYMLRYAVNPEMSAFDFFRAIKAHELNWGNGYAEIERNPMGKAVALWLIPPYRVHPARSASGTLGYVVTLPDNTKRGVLARDMLHFRGPSFDGIEGYGRVEIARQAIALGIATERYGATFFRRGGVPDAYISRPAEAPKWSKKGRERFRETFEGLHTGLEKSHRMAILEEGMEIKTVGLPPETAQMLQTRRFQIEEIARFYDIPLHMLKMMDRSTFNNIEQQNREFLDLTMEPHFDSTEQELNRKLLLTTQEQNTYCIDHDTRKLGRGDSNTRWTNYRTALTFGVMSPDEVRYEEGLNPIDGGRGNVYFYPLNENILGEQSNATGTQNTNPDNPPEQSGNPQQG